MNQSNQYSYCNVEGMTDVGCKRKANEDWLAQFECQNGLVAVVCDGMGGHVGGAVASHVAVETIQQFLETTYFNDPRQAIVEACDAANAAILQRTTQQPELKGMGSTCVMLIVRDGKVYIGSVGDSRIYLIRSKTITQLTRDQSYVQMLVDAGEITKEQAEHHPRKNEILNALGIATMQPATVLPDAISPEAGDCFLLCSDGLSGMVPDRDILHVVSDQTRMTQRERVATLIQRARENGGLDNITCTIVEFAVTPGNPAISVSEPITASMPNKKRWVYILLAVLLVVLLGAGGYALGRMSVEDEQVESTDDTDDEDINASDDASEGGSGDASDGVNGDASEDGSGNASDEVSDEDHEEEGNEVSEDGTSTTGANNGNTAAGAHSDNKSPRQSKEETERKNNTRRSSNQRH